MDPRIGILNRNGNPVYYAFINGYDQPETQGTLEEIEVALGIRQPEARPVKKSAALHDYVVTLIWRGAEPEEITVSALNNADAIRQGREWKNAEYGRTRSCNTLPCTFKARRASDD